ncbi:MAG: outer membrane protein assembly factor BamE [Betaproteobacteria bacterium]|nr:outer membrane protein assembly factor BamE [Betaproteobacteria bacterium]
MKIASCRPFSLVRPEVLALLMVALLPACGSLEVPKVPGVTPYRMVIQQGNFISQEMVSQLKPGMSKEQVRFILGTPLVTDIFHAERWDYVFFREMPDGKREQRNLSVVFENGKLTRVLGDLLPAEGATRSSGFETQVKPDLKPSPAVKPAPKPESKPAAGAAKPVAETPKPAAEPDQPAEDKKEPGFFERWRQKIGL